MKIRAMEKQILFIAMYNPMIYESSFGIISIHRTERGAQMAMEFHKEEQRKEWLAMYPTKDEQEEYPFASFESWKVGTAELLD